MRNNLIGKILVGTLIILIIFAIASYFYTPEKLELARQESGTSNAPVAGWKKYSDSILTFYYPPYLKASGRNLGDEKGNLIQFTSVPQLPAKKRPYQKI